jgi:nitric oxide reductase NorD protein
MAGPSAARRPRLSLEVARAGPDAIEARQRLIILVRDGKPMDTGYDPNTRYAQHDVRMACEEGRRQEIFTFCISTEENSRADMEIMFPDRRFAILSDIRQLPRVLPALYVKLTV